MCYWKLHGSDGVWWQGKVEDYVMAGERKQSSFASYIKSKTSRWV